MTSLTDDELRALVLETLGAIAPETRGTPPAGDVDLREELEIDSMDFLNFIVGLAKRTGVDVPEKDYPKLFTLDGAVAYLKSAPNRASP
jgi:acyl carrier protein